MKPIHTILLLLAAGVGLGATAQGWRSHYYHREARAYKQALKDKWSAGRFVEIAASAPGVSARVATALGGLPADEGLGDAMESELQASVRRMLDCFSTGNRAAYRAFHFPVDTSRYGAFHPARMAVIREGARRAAETARFRLSESASDEEVFVDWGFYQAAQPPFLVCTNCWRKVNAAGIEVRIQRVAGGKAPSLHSVAREFEPLRSTSVFPSVVSYEPGCQAMLDAGRTVVFAFVRVPVEMARGEMGAYPVYASFYWAERHGKWIPWEMAMPSTEGGIRVWF